METGNFFEEITMKNFVKGAILEMALCGTANLFAADCTLSDRSRAFCGNDSEFGLVQ